MNIKNIRYFININLSLGYYFKGDIEQSYKFLENIDLSKNQC